ncbi:MAG: capsular polysaccharide biosynthesis protein, partial [Paracoccaceae bacterium]
MQHKDLRDDQRQRVLNVIDRVIRSAVTKYNLPGNCPKLPEGHRILVPGQVEDDASILKGTDRIRTNIALLKEVRRRNPKSIIIYKPHPDVEAGLRKGNISQKDQDAFADVIAHQADPAALLSVVQEIHTMTSNLGFEALLRG